MEGGASPASLLTDEKLPKNAQNADYHRKPTSACSLQHGHGGSIQRCRIAYDTVLARYILLGHCLPEGNENALTTSSSPCYASHA